MRALSLLLLVDASLESLHRVMQQHFDHIYHCEDGEKGWRLYQNYTPSCIIVSHKLGSLDGLSLVEKIRLEDRETPILFLSNSSKTDELLRAIELHLEGYMLYPHKQLQEIERRVQKAQSEIIKRNRIYLKEGFVWNGYTKELSNARERIHLSKQESLLLEFLTSRINYPCSYEEIYYAICEDESYSKDAINSIVKRLRKKSSKSLIKTLYTIGYKIEV
jgi:DNA-binding response OmpR family regulator